MKNRPEIVFHDIVNDIAVLKSKSGSLYVRQGVLTASGGQDIASAMAVVVGLLTDMEK